MSDNGRLDVTTLVALSGFDPYPDSDNFLAPSVGTHSNLVLPGVLTDAVNLQAAFKDYWGEELVYAEAYRSYTMQQQRWAEYQNGGSLAAEPGTSNHGWAQAIDWRNSIGTKTGPTYRWMVANAGQFGFVNDVATEGWHWHHPSTTAVTVALTTASTGTTTPIGDEDMPLNDDDKHFIQDTVKNAFTDVNLQTLIANQVVARMTAAGAFSAAQGKFIQDAIKNSATDPNIIGGIAQGVVNRLPKS